MRPKRRTDAVALAQGVVAAQRPGPRLDATLAAATVPVLVRPTVAFGRRPT